MQRHKVIFLVGPTAAGKSETALALAKKINAEIVSCDSMQIYKGMDIITSKAKPALRKKVPHHLIDIISADTEYNVSRYRIQAVRRVKEIISRGKTPLFVGGTGLYMSILVDGIFKSRAQDENIRKRLYRQAGLKGSACLHARLKKIDPQAAQKIHPNDLKRIVRALEVFLVTGKTISSLQKERRGLASQYDIRVFCLDMPRSELYSRIEKRVEAMFRQGLLGEAGSLLKKKLSRTASCAIGLAELKGYFDGLYGLDEAKRLMKRNSRLYAKRQLTWFRKDKRIEWIHLKGREKPGQVVDKILKLL